MSCRFCIGGCPINNKFNCCYECDNHQQCIEDDEACSGMPETYKECNYYDKTPIKEVTNEKNYSTLSK